MAKKVKEEAAEITIMEMHKGQVDVCLVGDSPLVYNSLSERAKHELLFPAGRKNAAARAASLKHNPIDEYRNSVYSNRDNEAPTRLVFPAPAFKKALASAALDVPGTAKAVIGRLSWCVGTKVDIYGVPQLYMTAVKQAGLNGAPDIRTRAILPEWACRVTFSFIQPILKSLEIMKLLAVAGMTQGIGDGRQQKGSLSFGQFHSCSVADPDFVRICAAQGREAQDLALQNPTFFDENSENLYTWFNEEYARRFGGQNSVPMAAEPETEDESLDGLEE